MANGFGINGAAAAQSALPGVQHSAQAAEAASKLPNAPASGSEVRQPSTQSPTTFTAEPAVSTQVHSKVVQRLLNQNASIYGPGLARVPLPPRPEGEVRTAPKKPAGPMVDPRHLNGGYSPLAGASLYDAQASRGALGAPVDDSGEHGVLANAREGAWRMPSRHGLVAYTTTARGDKVYLTQERWLHIRENHMDPAPQPRGKRTTTYWPTQHAVNGPSMTDEQVIGVIVDSIRKGTLRTEVRDTRMAEYDLPADQREAYGVSEAKVSMAPDGLVLSAYPGAGSNVLAVYEMSEADQAALAQATGGSAAPAAADDGDTRLFKTNVAQTTFG